MIESMFEVGSRPKPWNTLGTCVSEAVTSAEAINLAGLNWRVKPMSVYTEEGIKIEGFSANVRDIDRKPLGIVGSRYSIVQNEDAFKFTDSLIGEGVKYETAGAFKNGKAVWLLAKLPNRYEILGDEITPYIVFINTHDGSGSIKVAMTPIRVVCNNMLNLALKNAKRTWSARHTGTIELKLQEAKETLKFADEYMKATNSLFEELYKIKLNEFQVRQVIADIVPINEEVMNKMQIENQDKIRADILYRFKEAPDLKDRESTGARLIQAVSDTVTHIEPFRRTSSFEENRFKKSIEGFDLLNRALERLTA